ncbi:MAG: ATP-binding protein [Planctomycetes bacterium]|nr:ATP-binding protein [Planctomycetota bacterium]
MKRLAEAKLLKWKSSSRRKPLIVRGARQVGKTWLIKQVLADHFDSIAVVDFEARPDAGIHFEENLVPHRILKSLEFITGRVVPGKTILFFDEIQACPKAITALRYFYEEMPELHVVAAGSLLEFAFGQISVPVGRLQYLHMSPMTFYEYLLAGGKDVLAENLLLHPSKISPAVQDVMLRELKNYFLVGGMPEVVKTYWQSNSFLEAFEVQDDILKSYQQDFHKYTPKVSVSCLDRVFAKISESVGHQLKYTHLDADHSYQTNHKAFDLLCKAKIIQKVSSCIPSGLPLAGSVKRRFKACMLDIGLMQRLCGIDSYKEMSKDNLLSMYRGQLAEQFVAQELLAWHSEKLYYWSRSAKSSNAEIDYLTVREGKIYPIEVKSGSAGRLRSLHLCLETYPNCKQGWVLQDGPYQALPEQRLVFWPLYATPQLGSRQQLPLECD